LGNQKSNLGLDSLSKAADDASAHVEELKAKVETLKTSLMSEIKAKV
jgi:hypothetical protein